MSDSVTLIRASALHCKSSTQLEGFDDACLAYDSRGKILAFGPWQLSEQFPNASVSDFSGKLLLPGFVDTHVHLPQYLFAGLGAHELLPWLETYTFPIEMRFAEESFAANVSEKFFSDLIAAGTTLASVYATAHTKATDLAFETAERKGIRALIGKVLMERNAPDGLCHDWRPSIAESESLAEKWHGREGRLFYAVTPRFAITCSEDAMRAAGELARRRSLFIQTHLAENLDEIAFVQKLFPSCGSYTEVYAKCGLLTDKTLLGHCIYLDSRDIRMLLEEGAVAVHCPTSNRHLQSGFFPLRRYEELGVRMALGTDVAGGYDLSMLHEMRESIETSKCWNIMNRAEARAPLSSIEALHMATLGGAEALAHGDKVGNFALGKEADFVLIDDSEINGFKETGLFQTSIDRLTRVIYRGSRAKIQGTYVCGKKIY